MVRGVFLACAGVSVAAAAAATCGAGCRRSSDGGPATVATAAPVPATSHFRLKGAWVGGENIAFSWTEVAGARQYRIEISTDGLDFFSSSLIDPGLTAYEFGGFDPGESFIFRSVAVASDGTDVAVSNLVSVTVPGPVAP